MKDHLAVAKVAQNDEYYTLEQDVETQIQAIPEILQKMDLSMRWAKFSFR